MPTSFSGDTYEELLGNLRKADIMTEKIHSAMLKVDRAHYVQKGSTAPYGDNPKAIGYAATISAPHVHASFLELLKDHLKPGSKALDVGSGSGYVVAIMAHLVQGEGGRAIGIEHIPELVEFSQSNVQADCPQLLEDGTLKIVLGDGRLGLPEEGPFDCIQVGAGAATVPDALTEQLKPGGRLVIPVGTDLMDLKVIDKDANGVLSEQVIRKVKFVPLTSRESQMARVG
ncbi:hypothetical protein HDU67_003474 [Dinochytrium kinnereticum]|nr:hypothetical protein HDU67_003474 [Dinochytrium kinnereticum]